MIKAAAIKFEGEVWTGSNHGEIRRKLAEAGKPRLAVVHGCEDGFVTEDDRFVDRHEAADIALHCGQIKEIKYSWGLCSSQLNLAEGEQHGKGTENGCGT